MGQDGAAFDCSELAERGWAEVGVKVPDGCVNQMPATRALAAAETRLVGDVRFFQKPGAAPHHVILDFGDGKNVIEARGEPFNAVILRPVAKSDAWPEATEWRRFLAVDVAEGKA